MKITIRGTLPGLNEYINAERTSRYKGAAMKKTGGACCHTGRQKSAAGMEA